MQEHARANDSVQKHKTFCIITPPPAISCEAHISIGKCATACKPLKIETCLFDLSSLPVLALGRLKKRAAACNIIRRLAKACIGAQHHAIACNGMQLHTVLCNFLLSYLIFFGLFLWFLFDFIPAFLFFVILQNFHFFFLIFPEFFDFLRFFPFRGSILIIFVRSCFSNYKALFRSHAHWPWTRLGAQANKYTRPRSFVIKEVSNPSTRPWFI